MFLGVGMTASGDAPGVRFISHRGESLDAPENTMASFRSAIARKADGFECDIYLTKDSGIVCLHDGTTKRTADRNLVVSNSTLSELRALDAGAWKGPQFKGERLPTLSETLALARDRFEIYVEIKSGTEIVPQLVKEMAAEPKATPDRVLFICFKTNVVAALRQQLPAYRTYWLTGTGPKKDGKPGPTAAAVVAAAKVCNASGVDAQDSADITPEFVNGVKADGLSFHIWTVDDAPRAAELAAMGVDTITSNCGAELVALLRLRPDGCPMIRWSFDGALTNSGSGGPAFDAMVRGTPAYTNGIAGQALVLDGTNAGPHVVCPLSKRGTIALWYRPAALYNFNTVFDTDRNADQWEMWIGNKGTLRFRMEKNSGEVSADLLRLGGQGQWHHLALVWDNVATNRAWLYVDGTERASGSIKRWVAPGGVITLGGGNAKNTKGRGLVDDVRIYAEPLAKSQVQDLFVARPDAVIDEGFEGKLPDFHTYQATYAADAAQAHGGAHSLRVTPTRESGGAYFKLDGSLDFASGYEYSAWVRAGVDGAASVYVSASDGKERYTVSSARGGVAGKWVQLRGVIRASQWRPGDREFMLALSTRGESRFDDVTLRKADVPDPAIEVWPRLEKNMHAAADARAGSLRRGQRLELDARRAALAPATDQTGLVSVAESAVAVPSEGMLTFAVDVAEPLVVTGELELEPDADLRPGLRATVLSDDTVVGAPMVKAAPWFNMGKPEIGPAPAVLGTKPAAKVKLTEWRLDKGRHYLTVAGPHRRPAGLFRRLTLQALEREAKAPLYTFALFADTHLGAGRSEWMNVKMDEPSIAELGESLRRLRGEGVSFAFIAGDMTDGGSRSQIESLAGTIRRAGLPVYGCIGNHEVFTAGSRTNLMALVPGLFPSGNTQYALDKPPLRFVVLDGSWWRDRAGNALDAYDKIKAVSMTPAPAEIDWLRRTLAVDTRTPTLVMWHYPFYSGRGETSCGYRLGKPMIWSPEVMSVLESATNVVATLNGHMHYNAVDTHKGIVCLQNAAFAEWPNLYRVLRVYSDRIEWEVRQVHNRGFVSEGVLPEKALTWMISTREGDLAGRVDLAPRKNGK